MSKDTRDSWENYFMKIAKQVSERATCNRKKIGAILVRDRMILSTGYNGSIRGLPHCDDIGHMMEGDHCVRTIHAEMNLIAQAARNGINTNNSELYVTTSPCWLCFRLLANAGIQKIVFEEFYKDERIFEAATQADIQMEHLLSNRRKKINGIES